MVHPSHLREFLLLSWINFVNLATPGPGFTIVVRHSAFHHHALGVMTGLGITAAGCIHKTYILLGFGIITEAPPLIFKGIQYAGGAFLIYLGLKTIFPQFFNNVVHKFSLYKQYWILRRRSLPPSLKLRRTRKLAAQDDKLSYGKAFSIGFWVNFLNPMASISFLCVVLATIDPETPLWLRGVYSLLLNLPTFFWFAFISFFFSREALKKVIHKFETPLNYLAGGFLIYLGLPMLFGK